ncbi:hypothetical protein KBD75_01120 [Candidatus Woesebacteria bacterium]|nr:hypothetical protein [Candidatus Woesebacteria bacterium]
MAISEIDKAIETYKQQFISFDKSIPNSILLTASVLLVFVASIENEKNIFIWTSVVSFAISLLIAIAILKRLKLLSLKAYNDLIKAKDDLHNAKSIEEIERVSEKFSTKTVGKSRDILNLLENSTILFFGIGVIALIIGLIYPDFSVLVKSFFTAK